MLTAVKRPNPHAIERARREQERAIELPRFQAEQESAGWAMEVADSARARALDAAAQWRGRQPAEGEDAYLFAALAFAAEQAALGHEIEAARAAERWRAADWEIVRLGGKSADAEPAEDAAEPEATPEPDETVRCGHEGCRSPYVDEDGRCFHHRPTRPETPRTDASPCESGCGRKVRNRRHRFCLYCRPGQDPVPVCHVANCSGPGQANGRCLRHKNWRPPRPECAAENCGNRSRPGSDFCGHHRTREAA